MKRCTSALPKSSTTRYFFVSSPPQTRDTRPPLPRLHHQPLPPPPTPSQYHHPFCLLRSNPRSYLSTTSISSNRAPFFASHTAVPVAFVAMDAPYTFPTAKMQTKLTDGQRTPLVLISCGSFSPITYLHLRMFEMCKDWVKENTQFEVVAGYLSPVADAYEKQGLALASHRIEMCQLAAAESSWIMVDDWEAIKPEYTRTALVLDHFQYEINQVLGGIETSTGAKVPARISLMSGADLIQTMSNPGVWAEEDLDHILGRYGAFIIERHGTDLHKALESLQPWRDQIYPIPQLIQNDVSSTKIRNFLRKDMSIRYLIPEPALKYIDQHNLFKDEATVEPGHKTPVNPPKSTNGNLINGA